MMITQLPTEQIREFHPVISTSNSSLKLIIPCASWRLSVSNKQPSRVFLLTLSNSLHIHLYYRSLKARILHPYIYWTGHLGVLNTNKSWRTALPSIELVLGASTIAESLMKALSLSWIIPFMLGMGMLLRRFMTLPEFRWNCHKDKRRFHLAALLQAGKICCAFETGLWRGHSFGFISYLHRQLSERPISVRESLPDLPCMKNWVSKTYCVEKNTN